MARNVQRSRPASWRLDSVWVKARDGPQRLTQVYRLLVAEADEPIWAALGQPSRPSPWRERGDASRRLRPRLDRTPGARADHRQPDRHPDRLGPSPGV